MNINFWSGFHFGCGFVFALALTGVVLCSLYLIYEIVKTKQGMKRHPTSRHTSKLSRLSRIKKSKSRL